MAGHGLVSRSIGVSLEAAAVGLEARAVEGRIIVCLRAKSMTLELRLMVIDERHAILIGRSAATVLAASRESFQAGKEFRLDEFGSRFEQIAIDYESRVHVKPLTARRAGLAIVVQSGMSVTDENHVFQLLA